MSSKGEERKFLFFFLGGAGGWGDGYVFYGNCVATTEVTGVIIMIRKCMAMYQWDKWEE